MAASRRFMLPSPWPGILDWVSARLRESRPRPRLPRLAPVLGTLAVLIAAAACTSSPGLSPLPPSAASTHAPAAPASQVAAAPGPVPSGPPRITVSQDRMADGSVVTLAVFAGVVRYTLHDG